MDAPGEEQHENIDAAAPLLDAIRGISDAAASEYVARASGTYVSEPLMERIERDARARRGAWLAAAFGLGIVIVSFAAAGVISLVGWARGSAAALRSGVVDLTPPSLPGVLVPFAFAALLTWVAVVWLGPVDVRRLARAYGAHLATAGEVPASVRALAEISPAFGLATPPALLVIETPALNAFSAGRLEKGIVAVTRGLAEGMPADEQRAVFAHVLTRLILGAAPYTEGGPTLEEQGDALAMQALRDPHAMLTALERVVEADTAVTPRGFAANAFFFAPQMPTMGVTGTMRAAQLDVRLRRLRAVLGAAAVGE